MNVGLRVLGISETDGPPVGLPVGGLGPCVGAGEGSGVISRMRFCGYGILSRSGRNCGDVEPTGGSVRSSSWRPKIDATTRRVIAESRFIVDQNCDCAFPRLLIFTPSMVSVFPSCDVGSSTSVQ